MWRATRWRRAWLVTGHLLGTWSAGRGGGGDKAWEVESSSLLLARLTLYLHTSHPTSCPYPPPTNPSPTSHPQWGWSMMVIPKTEKPRLHVSVVQFNWLSYVLPPPRRGPSFPSSEEPYSYTSYPSQPKPRVSLAPLSATAQTVTNSPPRCSAPTSPSSTLISNTSEVKTT